MLGRTGATFLSGRRLLIITVARLGARWTHHSRCVSLVEKRDPIALTPALEGKGRLRLGSGCPDLGLDCGFARRARWRTRRQIYPVAQHGQAPVLPERGGSALSKQVHPVPVLSAPMVHSCGIHQFRIISVSS